MNSSVSTFPALVFLTGPWLLLGLVLSGPFLLLLTVFAAAAVLAGVLALPVLPFVLLHRHLAHRRQVAPAFKLVEATA